MKTPEAVAAVRRLARRVRRVSRLEDLAAGSGAVVCGTCASTLAWRLASKGAGVWAFVLLAAGMAAACVGVWWTARAAIWPPSIALAAGWIERALPELRDSLVTALEGGALAGVSAEYAADRIEGTRPAAFVPAGSRARRAGVVAGSAALLAAAAVAAMLWSRRPRVPPPRTNEVSAPREAAGSREAASAGRGEAEAGATGTPGGKPRMTLHAVAPGAVASDRAGLDATEVLLRSPSGFEGAVEVFLATGDGEAEGGDDSPGDARRSR